jgi:hypothetical protein
LEHFLAQQFSTGKALTVDEFDFQRVEEALGDSVDAPIDVKPTQAASRWDSCWPIGGGVCGGAVARLFPVGVVKVRHLLMERPLIVWSRDYALQTLDSHHDSQAHRSVNSVCAE